MNFLFKLAQAKYFSASVGGLGRTIEPAFLGWTENLKLRVDRKKVFCPVKRDKDIMIQLAETRLASAASINEIKNTKKIKN